MRKKHRNFRSEKGLTGEKGSGIKIRPLKDGTLTTEK